VRPRLIEASPEDVSPAGSSSLNLPSTMATYVTSYNIDILNCSTACVDKFGSTLTDFLADQFLFLCCWLLQVRYLESASHSGEERWPTLQ
jgi:hypothetical protein